MLPVAEDLWLLPGLGPFPYLVNCYLLHSTDGDILVDTGTCWAAGTLLRALRGRRLRLVVLTHLHPDHQGAAAAICRRLGVPLACHEADADVCEGRAPMRPRTVLVRVGDHLLSGPAHPVAWRLQGGEEIGEWQVVHLPGHTPGHIVLVRPRDGVLLAGDLVRGSFRPGGPLVEPPHFFSVDPELNRRSIAHIPSLRPTLLCFGHGRPTADPGGVGRLLQRWE